MLSKTVFAPACRKTSVEFYDCTAVVTTRGHGRVVNVTYKVWLTDDGCWGTSIRTHGLQPAALGPRSSQPLRTCGRVMRAG